MNQPTIIFSSSDISFGNMSVTKGDSTAALANRQEFFASLGIDTSQIIPMNLKDTSNVLRVGTIDLNKANPNKDMSLITGDAEVFADGLITDNQDLYLFMLSGDCIPLGLYDIENQSIGLLHCSWRNLDEGIIASAINAMSEQFSSDPKKIYASIGPSIGPCCYIKKTADIRQQDDSRWKPFIRKTDPRTSQIDIWSFAISSLIETGLSEENIYNPKVCTYHSKKYFSHRRFIVENLEHDYRFATIIGIKSEQ